MGKVCRRTVTPLERLPAPRIKPAQVAALSQKAVFASFALLLLLAACSAPPEQTVKIAITQPVDGAFAVRETLFGGTVSHPDARIFLVVHPLGSYNYYVQHRGHNHQGRWQVSSILGRAGERGNGREFEVRAVADMSGTLESGQELDDWPEAAGVSEPIVIIRK